MPEGALWSTVQVQVYDALTGNPAADALVHVDIGSNLLFKVPDDSPCVLDAKHTDTKGEATLDAPLMPVRIALVPAGTQPAWTLEVANVTVTEHTPTVRIPVWPEQRVLRQDFNVTGIVLVEGQNVEHRIELLRPGSPEMERFFRGNGWFDFELSWNNTETVYGGFGFELLAGKEFVSRAEGNGDLDPGARRLTIREFSGGNDATVDNLVRENGLTLHVYGTQRVFAPQGLPMHFQVEARFRGPLDDYHS